MDPRTPMVQVGTSIPTAPHSNNGRRPRYSIASMAGMVAKNHKTAKRVCHKAGSNPKLTKMAGPKLKNVWQPESCWSACKATPTASKRATRPEQRSLQLVLPEAVVTSTSNKISASSASASASVLRIRLSTSSAASCLPRCTSQRGERGQKKRPTNKTTQGTLGNNTPHLQPSSHGSTNMSVKTPTNTPKPIIPCEIAPSTPRR
mmetsp:Transcript_107322/g.269134  ORF Transcript_107322/g.269134 Transcript_107322/m.269134 type:complete len:204 (-) Transcript_107322:503-1114(-)